MKFIIIILLLLFINGRVSAQDPVFSQFYAAPMQLNPALTGLVAAPVLTLNYRNQWPSIPNAYSTYAVSFSQYIPKINSGLGVLIEADIAGGGIYSTYKGGLFYSYDIRFSKKLFIRAGIDAYFVNSRLSNGQLVFLDQLNPETGAVDNNGNVNPTNEFINNQSFSYFDMGAGFLFNSPWFHAGVSIKHLTIPKESFIKKQEDGSEELPLRITINIGSEFQLSKRNKIKNKTFLSPNALFIKQREFHQLNIGAYLRYGLFSGGIWLRHTFTNTDAVILMVGVRKGIFKIGYSYDFTVSGLGMKSGGAHEVSISFNFENKKQKYSNRYNDCLEIFR